MVTSGSASNFRAWQICCAVSLGLRPPLRPRARAAANPALVRSRDQIAFHLGERCHYPEEEFALGRAGIDLSAAVQGAEIDAAMMQSFDEIDKRAQPAPQAVEFPYDKAVAFA